MRKGSEDAAYIAAKLGDVMVDISGVKRDVKSAREDPEIEFQVASVEKDTSAGVEERVAERAQETLSPMETTTGTEKFEVDETSSSVPVSQTLVSSPGRTDLLLLEEESSHSNIPGDITPNGGCLLSIFSEI